MHICFISHEYPIWGSGGVGSFIQTLGRELVARGHRVSVVGISKVSCEEYYDDQGVQVFQLPMSGRRRLKFIGNSKILNRKLWEIYREHPFDILESAELGLAFVDKKLPTQKVIRMHGGHHFFAVTLSKKPAIWRSWQEKRSFKKADHLIAVSRFVGETTMKLLQSPGRDFTVIYNPINTKSFNESLPEKVEMGNLLFVGTMCEKKGVRQLIQAIPYVLQKYPNIMLNTVGRDWANPKTGESYIEGLKSTFSVEELKNVNFVGEIKHDEIPAYLERAQVCVFPSHMEAMPIAWLEGLAMGKPFVASNTGPGPEAVLDGKTGLLCDPYNPNDIADKIIYMLGHPDEAKTMGKQARKDVLKRFSIDKLVDKNIQFYQRCLSQ